MLTKKIRLGILISGRGSNMQALINACLDSDFPAQVACVISNNINAKGILFAKDSNIPIFTVQNNPLDTNEINNILCSYNVDLVCLAGFMKILSADFLKAWENRVINVHPSLLPAFKGLNAQEQALKAGVKVAGCTVHYVTPEIDTGPIIIQAAVPILQNDDVMAISERILKMEHVCYTRAVKLIAQDQIKLKDNIVISNEALGYWLESF